MLLNVTAHRPDSVVAAVRTNFTGPDDINLVVNKCTHFELHLLIDQDVERTDDAGNVSSFTEKALRLVKDVPIYGRISTIKAYRPEGRATDLLFITTEKCMAFIVSFNPDTQRIETEGVGSIRDPKARPADAGHIGLVDPENRLLGLHISQGTFKIIPMFHRGVSPAAWNPVSAGSGFGKGKSAVRAPNPGELGESFNARLDELLVLSIVFLHTPLDDHPALAILYQDSKETRYLIQYNVNVAEKKLAVRKEAVKVESGASMLIPVPRDGGGGVLVVGEQTIALHHPLLAKPITTPIKATLMKCYNQVDKGLRYLLGDYEGFLYMLLIIPENGRPERLKINCLGVTAQATCIVHLSDGYVFVGSHYGDSELQLIQTQKDASCNYLSLRDTFKNLAPITDFCVVDLERQGQEQVVACCGGQKDGSLRIIRNGIGVEEIGQLDDMGELTGVWALRPHSAARHDTILVLSFISETRLQMMDGEAMAEVESTGGFKTSERTLACCNMPGDTLVQITPSSVVLLSCEGWMVVAEWSPPAGSSITHASAHHNAVLVSLGGGMLYLLEASATHLTVKSTAQLEHEISCLNISSLDRLGTPLCAVGCWGDNSVRLLRVPSLTETFREVLSGETIPRSILLVDFESVPYLLVSLGDGQLFNFHITSSLALSERKKTTLGTQPISLRIFQTAGGRTHVFAASDRPTVIFAKSGQLLYSNVNMREVTHMSPFNSAMAEGALALACDGVLKIGTIETVQKLHVRQVKLGESPRRIAFHEQASCFGVMTFAVRDLPNNEVSEMSCLRLLDSQSFDLLDSYDLHPFETALSIMVATLAGDANPHMIVGTGFAFPQEDEPTRGRILVFTITSTRGLRLVHEYETRGGAYSLASVHGRLLAGVNSKILVLRWDPDTSMLHLESTNHGHVTALVLTVRGDFVLVGDLIKSVTLLQFNPSPSDNGGARLEEIARDYDSVWMTALEAIDDDTFLGAEVNYNLFALRKQADAESEEERQRLRPVAFFHLGEMVNRFRRGKLTMHLPDGGLSVTPELLYCTVNGALGVIASLTPETYATLETLQKHLRSVVTCVGDLKHAEWRMFQTERKSVEDTGIIDGDLIETFLDLSRKQQEQIAERVAAERGVSFADLIKLIEDLTRIH
ncbi:hypothetical protein HK105_206146 [Polyrhizophydium stewartii]|uniref:DNA damage-binding protein 1 n=1 Tax=Polyrhizophydium stewartii TaxID=2732419 RepID=A0ABR4N4H7_9FUNG|nr:DNA damage-binding protein 1a [Polyrhizophydium stewartii]